MLAMMMTVMVMVMLVMVGAVAAAVSRRRGCGRAGTRTLLMMALRCDRGHGRDRSGRGSGLCGAIAAGGTRRLFLMRMLGCWNAGTCWAGRRLAEGERFGCWRPYLCQRQVCKMGAIALDARVGQVHGPCARMQADGHGCVVVVIDLRYNSIYFYTRCGDEQNVISINYCEIWSPWRR